MPLPAPPSEDKQPENARDQKIATMEADNMNDDARDSSASRGSRDEPIGHQYVDEYGRPSGFLWWREGETRWRKSQTVPLYLAPQPALTDEERYVLGRVADDAGYRQLGWTERVVRGLLGRLH
jgi:hypothetical protein